MTRASQANSFSRVRRLASRLALALGLIGVIAALGAGPAAAAGSVQPTLDCVANDGGGLHTAYFGYVNTAATTTRDVGDSNQFTPVNPFQSQPTTFDSGSASRASWR